MPTTPQQKPLAWLLLKISLLSLSLLVGCATPPDVPVFEDLQPHLGTNASTGHVELRPDPACEAAIQEAACGHGVYIMSQKEIFVGELPKNYFDKKPWSQLKSESVYVPAKESYAPLTAYIINACKKSNCSAEVDKFKSRLDELKNVGAVVGK